MDLLRSLCTASLLVAAGFVVPAAAQTAPAQNGAQNGAPAAVQPAAQPAAPPADQAHSDAQPAGQPADAAPEKRFALVIGNAQYHGLRAVPGAAISARRVAEALRRAGFEVDEATDLDRGALERVVRGFGARLHEAQVGAFYYAGRSGLSGQAGGLCMEPVDAPARERGDFAFECVPVGAVLTQLERNTANALVFWDADMPARARFSNNGPDGARGATRARAMLSSGMAMAFAAQPGETAASVDGSEQVSPFADALANAVSSPGLDVLELLRQVRRDVRGATNNAQTPWFRYGLDDELVLVPRPAPPPVAEAAPVPAPAASFSLAWQTRTPPPDPVALELAAWNAVIAMRSDNARRLGLIDFLQRFPAGQYASLARINLDDLDRPAAPAASAPPDPLTLELAEWQSVQSLSAAQRRIALQSYLQRYASGRFAPLARLQLTEMNEPVPPPPAAAPPGGAAPGGAAPGQAQAQAQTPAQAQAQAQAQALAALAQQRYVVIRAVPLRFEAAQEGRIVRTLQPYTIVQLRQRYARDQWIEVQAGTDRGFVYGASIKDIREAEEEEWARIQNSRDRATFETFLRRFPGGAFANEATRRRDQLAAAQQQQPQQPQP